MAPSELKDARLAARMMPPGQCLLRAAGWMRQSHAYSSFTPDARSRWRGRTADSFTQDYRVSIRLFGFGKAWPHRPHVDRSRSDSNRCAVGHAGASRQLWKYLDDGSAPAPDWRSLSFNDTAWQTGTAQLGYGDGDEATVVSYGPDPAAKYITTYFRRTFSVDNPSRFAGLQLRMLAR